MKLFRMLTLWAMVLGAAATAAAGDDFSWVRNFNIQAKADPAGFRARLAARFHLSDVQVIALRNIFASPADAYIMLRLGEMQGGLQELSKEQGIEAVKKYRNNRDKGWVVLAESLGVETESREFLDLKHDHDLHGGINRGRFLYSGANDSDKGNH